MRAKEFLFENLDILKNKVNDLVNNTRDETLLNKIYTALNSGTLLNRLSAGLESLPDVEIRSFVDEIANVIIQAPGTYEEKIAFVQGLKDGFIDVKQMIDGSRHHFSDLLTPTKEVPLKFLFDIFNSLKDLGSRARKGPGEFAIAIMSPRVSVFGGGDLKIDNKTVEVKAGSGTIGATGLFQHQKVPIILQKYLPNIDLNQNIGASALSNAVKSANLDPATLREFADELVNYIFKAQESWANTEPLKKAIINVQDENQNENIRKGYLIASYSAYKGGPNRSKFDGVMLIDFERQELRYFDDPEELFTDIEKPQFNFFSKNKEWGGKLISPGVKLGSQKLVKPEMPASSAADALPNYIQQQAEYLVKLARQRKPRDLDLRNPSLIPDVAATMSDLIDKKYKGSKLTSELLRIFPMLNVRQKEQPANINPPQTMNSPTTTPYTTPAV